MIGIKRDNHRRKPAVVRDRPEERDFVREVESVPGGETIRSCIQCGTCSASCLFASSMDYTPRMMILLTKANRRKEVLSSNTMWICASCYLCTVRCPAGVEITSFMHALESLAARDGDGKDRSAALKLYSAFMDSIRKNGRVHELGVMLDFYRRGNLLSAIKALPVGLALFARGRIPLKPIRIRAAKELAAIIESAESETGGAR
ncbi:MAG: 4Fe-4S dicluster domain-containing protein [Gemmatimonadetes bacterium]|nr:4Fe-4S dicluster domain-containing protein [Gemmatimonadota bacterium]